ncbi:MAG: conserved phage C-terminal domain-containing protein [Desulfobacteraceae bacterium]|jgi:uncharacterized phage protein (TIGR02220 family)
MAQHPFFSIARKFIDSDKWLSEPFTRGQAWVDMIGKANFSDGFRRIRGIRVEIPRGFLSFSEVELAGRWRWSRGKVRRFLGELETEQQIEQQKTNVTTLIKIINYESYQHGGTAKETANGQQTDSKRTANDTATIIIDKNDKNDKKDKEDKIDIQPNTKKTTTTKDTIPYAEIVDYLNQKIGSKFKSTTDATKKHIRARWNEGYRIDDFKKVIDKKVIDWINDTKYSKYLRPDTLFGTKFEGYLNAPEPISSPYSETTMKNIEAGKRFIQRGITGG